MSDPTPLRPDEQVAGGFLYVTLGGQDYRLAVLSIRANREWTALLARDIRTKLGAVGPLVSADQVAEELAKSAETMMDLLIAYDAAGDKVLPDREWIDTHATDTECYTAMKRVTAAAYPFAPDLLRIVPEFIPLLMQSIQNGVAVGTVAIAASSRSTKRSAPSTAGRRATSKSSSPTSS